MPIAINSTDIRFFYMKEMNQKHFETAFRLRFFNKNDEIMIICLVLTETVEW